MAAAVASVVQSSVPEPSTTVVLTQDSSDTYVNVETLSPVAPPVPSPKPVLTPTPVASPMKVGVVRGAGGMPTLGSPKQVGEYKR